MTKDIEKWACRMYGESIRSGTTFDNFEKHFNAIMLLRRLAIRHGMFLEKECNEPVTQTEVNKDTDIQTRIVELVRLLFNDQPGTGVIFQGDPRGCTVKIKLPSGYKDDWGGDGFCIPGA